MKNISAKLRKEIPEFESGKTYKFKLLGTRYDNRLKRLLVPNSKKVLSQDIIYDHHAKKEVEIECVDRTLAGGDILLKKIFFKKDEAGVKTLSGRNKGDKALFEYLWLSNYNAANADKPWFIKPRGGCMYTFLEPEKSASEKVEEMKEINKAQQVVFDLSEDDLRIACEALGKSSADKFTYHNTMHEGQMRERLLNFAKKHPSRVLMLDEDLNLEIRQTVKKANEKGIISFDNQRQEVVWTNTGKRLCVIEPGKDAETTLVGFFITTKGKQVLKTILANLEGEPKKKKVPEKEEA